MEAEMINGKRRIFIAGDTGGINRDDVVRRHFADADEMIMMRGDIPVNPIWFCDPSDPFERRMRICLKELAGCDGIYMLKGWRADKGAKMEHFVALKLKLTIELEK
jgi:hypothetical protein